MNVLAQDPVTLAYHELRSPLGLVAMAMRSVAEDSVDESVRGRVEVVLRTVERMLRTTERVFIIARGGVVDEAQSYAPAEVAAQVGADMAAAGLPVQVVETEPRALVYGPRGVCETLVQSLLTNACDHHAPGTPIRMDLAADGAVPVITILNQLAATHRHHGLGAGSYLAHRLAEQVGATLSAERDEATFRVTIRFDRPGAAPAL